MNKAVKRVRVVGKGHSFCFQRLLMEWHRQESFADVVFTCIGSPEKSYDGHQQYRKIFANRSVLAAASPVFAAIFLENPLVEEDVRVTVAGFSSRSLSAVIEYVYTGSMVVPEAEKEDVEKLLEELCIPNPRKKRNLIDISVGTNSENANVTHVQLMPSPFLLNENQNSTKATQVNRPFIPSVPNNVSHINCETPILSTESAIRKEQVVRHGMQNGKDLPPVPITTQEQNSNRVSNRSIDALPLRYRVTTEQCLIPLIHHGLNKSSPEKTIVQPSSVFLPPIVAEIPTTEKEKMGKFSRGNLARVAHYRKVIGDMYEIPATMWPTISRKKVVPYPETRSNEPIENSVSKQLDTVSYFDKKPVRTYQEKPTTRKNSQLQKKLSLAGVRIDSVHQVNGKVHICTLGDLIVNQNSENLFVDYESTEYDNANSAVSQLSLEHNYSFGETAEPVDAESLSKKETANDQEDFKRAVHLTIVEQRRRNRLKQRLAAYMKEFDTMKKNAIALLRFCKSMKEAAHELCPDDQRPAKKIATTRKNRAPNKVSADVKIPCNVCNKLVKKSWLKRHMIIVHSEERNHLCDECGRTFVLKGLLRAHQLRQHETAPGNHVCEHCGRTFKFARYLNRHMTLHTKEKPHVCRYCDKSFRLKPVLVKHLRIHTGEKPFKCAVCDTSFRHKATYARHVKGHEMRKELGLPDGDPLVQGSRLKCDFCSMTFKLDLFLMLHRAKHTGETPALPCPNCTETFPSIRALTTHRKTQHLDSVFPCQLCPKVFTNKNNFEFHMKQHSDPLAIRKKYPLNAPADSGPCACDFCEKVFKSRLALDYHIKGIHLGDKGFKCPHCDKVFLHKNALDQHIPTHAELRPYKCDLCPSAFKKHQHLLNHAVIHTGERPYTCEHCNKSFPHKSTLHAHLRIHNGKRIMCSYCHKVLPSVAQLVRHEETCTLNINESSVD